MQAMVNIASFVTSPEIKKILSDADGIGTPATRSAIIETLFQRNYVRRSQKTIVSTSVGRSLIKSLPDVATTPDLTAVWEAAMRGITEGKQGLDPFLARVAAQIHQLVEQAKAAGPLVLEAQAPTEIRKASTPRAGGRKPAALRRVK
jgi:DNA topoisomerase-3